MNKIHLMGTALIALLLAACSAEMPIPDGPGQDSGLWQHRKSLSMKQVPNRLKSVWTTLPHSGASTRSESDIAAVDSVFSVPAGEFLATYDPNDNTWTENPAINEVDTVGSYGYVVTFHDEPGFVILGAYECLPEVLFYCEYGFYDNALSSSCNRPRTGFDFYMDAMNEYVQLKTAADPEDDGTGGGSGSGGGSNDTTYGPWARRAKIAGETGVPTLWGQDEPYNYFCPIVDDEKTPVGCLATAIAQLMAYYKYPASYNERTFHWDEMIQIYHNPKYAYEYTGSIAEEDVAFLMRSIGIFVRMNYAAGCSSAYLKNTMHAASKLGYPHTGILDHFNYEKVKNAIDDNKPVIFAGYDSHNEGHAWIVDAYYDVWRYMYHKGTSKKIQHEYVRCNWGWDGWQNGYAVADVFDYKDVIDDPGVIIKSSLGTRAIDSDDECNILCGKMPSISPTAFCRKVHIITGLNP